MARLAASLLLLLQVLLVSVWLSHAEEPGSHDLRMPRNPDFQRPHTQEAKVSLLLPPPKSPHKLMMDKTALKDRADELDQATRDMVLTDEIVSRHIPSAQPAGWQEGRYRPFAKDAAKGAQGDAIGGGLEDVADVFQDDAASGALLASFHGTAIKGAPRKSGITRVSRAAIQERIKRSPMLTRIAKMKVSMPKTPEGVKYVDPATGNYINKSKPSMKGAIKMARERAAKDPPLVVDWGDGIDPEHAPKDYVALPAKMAAARAKVIAARGGPDAPVPHPPPAPKDPKKERAAKKLPPKGVATRKILPRTAP